MDGTRIINLITLNSLILQLGRPKGRLDKLGLIFRQEVCRFKGSDSIPVFFGGDFNAVPHTDGGKSPASKKMIEEGFVDAYRSMYPDVKKYPGFTHMENLRIDQLYYKGKGLKNSFTEVISKWPSGFPSDHFLIVSKFELITSEENGMNIEK